MKKLSELKTGSSGTVIRISGDTHFQSRITAIGLTVESRLEVIQNYKNQPVLLYSRDTMIAINKKDSEKVMVEVNNH